MSLDAFLWLDQIAASHRNRVGDKAFHLSFALQQEQPVVPGFVVPAPVLQDFLGQVAWQEQLFADLPNSFLYIDANNPRQLQAVAQQIRQAIEATALPDALWAELEAKVKTWSTSAVIFRASFALRSGLDSTVSSKSLGLLASHICRTDRLALANGLKRAWSELFRARSLFYWQRLGVQLQNVQFAVLVQPIRSAEAAGELKIIGNQVQIRAVHGLGYGLTHGAADTYTCDLRTGVQRQSGNPQPYAYRIAAAGKSNRYTDLTNWLIDEQACLQMDLVQPQQRQQSVLKPEQLQTLIDLAQQTTAVFKMPLLLEWILDSHEPDSSGQSGFHLTQVIPQFSVSRQAIAPAVTSEPFAPELASPSAFPQAVKLEGLAAAPGRAIAAAWVLSPEADLATVPTGAIVIATQITPKQVMQLRRTAGIVAEQGGMTSHAAILARELQLPAVVGVKKATQDIKTGDRVAIDGDQGAVYYGLEENSSNWPSESRLLSLAIAAKAHTRSLGASRTQLYVTCSQLDHLKPVAALPTAGVGLLRSEMLLLDLPWEQLELWSWQPSAEIETQIADRLQQFAAAFAPRPIFYRSLDLQLTETSPTSPGALQPTSIAPTLSALGMRGSLSYKHYPNLFKLQLAALRQVQQRGYSNISLILPFVRTVEEFVFCRQQVEQVGLMQEAQFQLWIMAEVPSVLFLLADYVAAGLQGISIGMNDLTQLLLAVDRDHPQLATAFNPTHPAVLRAVQHLIQTAQNLGIPCVFCGQLTSSTLLTSLLEWGVSAISVNPSEVSQVQSAIERFYQVTGTGL